MAMIGKHRVAGIYEPGQLLGPPLTNLHSKSPTGVAYPAINVTDRPLGQMRAFDVQPLAAEMPTIDVPSPLAGPARPRPQGMSKGQLIAGILADALAGAAGQGPQFAPLMERRRQEQAAIDREDQLYRRHRADAAEDRRAQLNAPRFFSGKEDQLQYDPVTGAVKTIYDAPTDAEAYAKAAGAMPGTPEYRDALSDYLLKGYGPTAMLSREDLERVRNSGRATLEGMRQRNRLTLRGQPNWRDLHPRVAPYRRGAKSAGSGATATGPNGQKIVVKDGRWVDAQTGAPVQ